MGKSGTYRGQGEGAAGSVRGSVEGDHQLAEDHVDCGAGGGFEGTGRGVSPHCWRSAARKCWRRLEVGVRKVWFVHWWRRDVSQPSARPKQVALVLDELRRRTDELSRRSESMSARCGILIASAALVAALQEGRAVDGWLVAGVVLSLVAAVLGVVAIFPRRIRYPEIEETRSELYRRASIADAQWWLVDRLTEQYADAREFLKARGHLLRWGFVLLGLSIIATAGSVVTEFRGRR